LRVLLFKPQAKFSELNKEKMTTDHFSFHLKQLLASKLVKKTEEGKYELTTKGKEFANRFDTEKVVLERQAKIAVLIGGIKTENGEEKFLIQQRLKQPYWGFYGFVTGKITWGETVFETAKRELNEETNLEGKLTLVAIKHKMDYSKRKKLLEDKYFFVFKATSLKGKQTKKFEGGKNIWLTKKEILKIPNLFDGVEETIKMITQKNLLFSETKYTVSSY